VITAVHGTRRALLVAFLIVPSALAAGCYWYWLRDKRTRPWHLEARLESLLAECRTGPGSRGLRTEYMSVEQDAANATACLRATDNRSWLGRDYSTCESLLLSACLEAQAFKLKLGQRRQEQAVRLSVLTSSLRHELGAGAPVDKIWSRFEFRSLDQTRARSLLIQAERLAQEGEVESALELLTRARAAWQRFSDQSDLEFARFEDPAQREVWDGHATRLLSWSRETGRRAILIDKLEHRCFVLKSGEIERSYAADLGRNWPRQKSREHDASTPEGEYRIQRMIPAGTYGRALLLDYPNSADRERFRALKDRRVISKDARIGGNVEIHGGGRNADWTDGCVSLAAEEMNDLYRRAYTGMPVTIVGACRLGASLRGR
jgi:hypothetical protein